MSRGRRPGLSREQVARAALQILDRDGLHGLTMQRIARKLGVGTMTLYGYFRSKDELLDAVIDVAVERGQPLSHQGSWRDQLHELIHRAHDNLARHPALVQIRFQQPVLRPEALRFAEAALRILHGAGFESEEAANAFRLLFTYVFGFAGLSPEQTAEEARRQAAAAIATLPPDMYPNLTRAAAQASAAMAGEEQFEFGLQCILDGLEAGLTRTARPPASGRARGPSRRGRRTRAGQQA